MRAIDGDALEKYLSDAEIEAIKQRRYVFASALNTICGNVRNFPTIEPERKKGKWLPDYSNNYEERFICSVCGKSYKVDTCMGEPMWDFCPCGSDMRGKQDGN